MSVLHTKRYCFEGRDGEIIFRLKVNVNKDGLFTAYYPEEAIEFLEKRFFRLPQGRGGKKGFLTSESMKGIDEQVEADFEKALECKLISSKPVIRYEIKAAANFCVDRKNNIFPDGSYGKYGKDGILWHESKKDSDRTKFFGFNVYAEVASKKEYETINGVKCEYEYMNNDACEELGEQIGKLSHWRNMRHSEGDYSDSDNLDDIDCTEQNARFFNSLFYNICGLALRIEEFLEPKKLQELIDSGVKLLALKGGNE